MKASLVLIAAGLSGCVFAANVSAAPKLLTSYDQLLQSLHAGEDVRAIIYYGKCAVKAGGKAAVNPADGADSRFNFNIYSHYKVVVDKQEKYTIATSNTILTEHAVFGPVYAYGRLRVFEDNSAEFHAAYYDPKTYEVKGGADWICQLSNGADNNGINLYSDS